MTVSVNVETGRRDRAIIVPNDALGAINGNRAEVWMVDESRAVRRRVELGLRGLTQTEITSGLRVGDHVLVDAQAEVTQGDRVRVVASSLPAGNANPATRKELPMKLN